MQLVVESYENVRFLKGMGMSQMRSVDLPNGLLVEMEKIAKAKGRPVDEVLVEAMEQYLNHEEFRELLSFGEKHAKSRGLTRVDISSEIARSRQARRR